MFTRCSDGGPAREDNMSFQGCWQLTDKMLGTLASRHPQLRSITLHGCSVTDAGLAALVRCCPLLPPNGINSFEKGDLFVGAVADTHPQSVHHTLCHPALQVVQNGPPTQSRFEMCFLRAPSTEGCGNHVSNPEKI